MAQFARPAADSILFASPWTPTPNFVEIDEVIPDDGTYISPTTSVVSDVNSVQLSAVTDPSLSTGHVMRIRLSYKGVAATTIDVVCNLYQGDPYGAGTFIAALDSAGGGFVINDSSGTGTFPFATFEYTLSGPEADAITDYSDLWISIGADSTVPPSSPYSELKVSWFELEVPDANICTWWKLDGPGGDDGPFGDWFKKACSVDGLTPPDDVSFNFDFFWDGVFYPRGTIFSWLSTTTPDDTGWWTSDVDFQGAATLLDNSRPKDPRSFTEISAFATGSTASMGGFPGPACTFNNRMIYAAGGYTVGTDLPSIRNFDGVSDREVATLPKTSAGDVPIGIMSMITANGTVYLTTLDSGSSASNWSGRVFELDLESGNLIQIGSTFTSGQLPYTLAWHNGRLWMGTNSGAPGTTAGKVYYMRQGGVDSDWTAEHTLTNACVCSLWSFDGLLYVGCSAASGSGAKILVRGVNNAYTTSLTGSGTAENNAFLAMTQYSNTGPDKIYASYWNPSTASEIWEGVIGPGDSDPEIVTWSKVYDQTDDGITKPWIAFPVDINIMLAVAGGIGFTASLIETEDGNSWTDRTVFLTQSDTASTGLPGWSIVVR